MLNVAYMIMFYLRHCCYIPTKFMFSLPTLQSSSMRCIFVLLNSFGVNIKFLLEVLFTHTHTHTHTLSLSLSLSLSSLHWNTRGVGREFLSLSFRHLGHKRYQNSADIQVRIQRLDWV
jgi:hypothetical protein